MEEQDITNFSTPSSHRLPTISAADALQNASSRRRGILTGLATLDTALQMTAYLTLSKGLSRGHVTEIYGPPGAGKTALAIQCAVNALEAVDQSNCVVWIDTGSPMVAQRLQSMLSGYQPPLDDISSSPPAAHVRRDPLDRLHYLNVPSLAHLLTLFMYPGPKLPPDNTALVVVDNASVLFATAFPRSPQTSNNSSLLETARKASQNRAASRKWAVAGDLANAMAKLASRHSCAILVINQTATSWKGVRKAVLKPALSGQAWDAGIYNRIALYRDFAPMDDSEHLDVYDARRLRFATVLKVGGKIQSDTTPSVTAFVIEETCLREVSMASSELRYSSQVASNGVERVPKRKADEIADSEDEGEGDELGSDDDFGYPDDAFHDMVEEGE